MEKKKQMNIRLPAEWEKHQATIISIPHNQEDWPGKFSPIFWVYVEIVKKLSFSEKVFIIVKSEQQKHKFHKSSAKAGAKLSNIKYFKFATNRSWLRDTSPGFIENKINDKRSIEAVRFKFNGWAKYDNWKKDIRIPHLLAERLKLVIKVAKWNEKEVVLEGGAIDSNGKGTLLTTEECLLNQNTQVRNPGFNKSDYEEMFRTYLGIKNVIWLGKGIAGDDTHGHVDDLCRFVNSETVVLCRETNSRDDNYKFLEENYERMQNAKLENGTNLKVISLPMPSPLVFEGMRLPASYANFYIANTMVLVPTFNDEKDKNALGILSEIFPERKVIGINSVDLVWGLGTLHCLTHEFPL
jgi:agmatine deiminase